MNIIRTRLRNSNYNLFKRLLIILTSSSLFIAISGTLKTFFSFLLYGSPPSPLLLLATFLVIYSVYALNKITDTEEDQLNTPERSNLILKHVKLFKYTSCASYIFAVLIGLICGWKVLLILIFPLLAGIVYSIRIHHRIPRLKDIFAVKSIIVALSWTVGSTFLPIIYSNQNFMIVGLVFYFFFIKSMINTVLFDLMDVEGDEKIGANTIPVVMGPSRTIKLLLILNSTLIVVILFSSVYGFFQAYLLPLIFCVIYGYLYILYFYHNKIRLQLEIMVDGEWVLMVFISLLHVKTYP